MEEQHWLDKVVCLSVYGLVLFGIGSLVMLAGIGVWVVAREAGIVG